MTSGHYPGTHHGAHAGVSEPTLDRSDVVAAGAIHPPVSGITTKTRRGGRRVRYRLLGYLDPHGWHFSQEWIGVQGRRLVLVLVVAAANVVPMAGDDEIFVLVAAK
jgi:hypothetical protein